LKKISSTNVSNETETEKHPMSEQSKKAVEAVKVNEIQDAQNLGFNPYETCTVTSGQAKKTTNDIIHGEIKISDYDEVKKTSSQQATTSSLPKIEPPSSSHSQQIIYKPFDSTFATYLSSNDSNNFKSSVSILHKLLSNAIYKGSQDLKFCRVRLSNPKIQTNIVNVEGAMDLMMVFGFQLIEEDNESLLY